MPHPISAGASPCPTDRLCFSFVYNDKKKTLVCVCHPEWSVAESKDLQWKCGCYCKGDSRASAPPSLRMTKC